MGAGNLVRLTSKFRCLACFSGRSVLVPYRKRYWVDTWPHGGVADEEKQQQAVVEDDGSAVVNRRNGDPLEIEDEMADSR